MTVSKIIDHGGTPTSTAATTSAKATVQSQTPGSSLLLIAACNTTTTLNASTPVTDAKGNTWVRRVSHTHAGSNITVVLADCLAATSLLASGDLITAQGSASAIRSIYIVEFTALTFDSVSAGADASGSAALSGGAVSPVGAVALALGIYAVVGAGNISTPGAGYTNETGIATTGTIRTIDWESKIASIVASETATATASASSTATGITALYRDNAAAGSVSPQTTAFVLPSAAAIRAATR